jgi:L-asparagine permease
MSETPQTPVPPEDAFAQEQAGFKKELGARQLQMIAIGSAIGTGLFLGAGGRLQQAGPSLFLIYAVCGFFGYLILRALGELVVHRPSSGSFVSYTREFYGEKAAYVSGWLYWLNWAMTAVADATALAIYIAWFSQYEGLAFIGAVPQWATALVIVVLVVSLNLISVKVFGEMEFWFALVKVAALVLFLIIGILFVVFGSPSGEPTGFSLLSGGDWLFPNGLLPALIVVQGVVFAYAGIELVGTASGETKDAERIIPKAINTVILRIVIFYCGPILLLCLLMPYTSYSAGESPFVTFFSSIGVDAAGPIMQLVVITAAVSSMNAGVYSTGRILHSMSMAGSAPRFAQRLSASGVPVGGILLTAAVAMVGVAINFWVPEQAFEIVLNIAAIGTMASWAAIAMSHLKFTKLAARGLYRRPRYRAPGGIYSDYAVLVFLAAVIVLIALDYPVGTYTLASMLVVVPLLVAGWFLVRGRVRELAAQRQGYTGNYPVLARTPGMDRYASESPRVTVEVEDPDGEGEDRR